LGEMMYGKGVSKSTNESNQFDLSSDTSIISSSGVSNSTTTPTSTPPFKPPLYSHKNVRVTDSEGGSGSPSAAWNGIGYGVVWEDYRDGGEPEIYFTRIDKKGKKLLNDCRLTEDNHISYYPSIALSGENYGIVWSDYDRYNRNEGYIYFVKVNKFGEKIGEVKIVTNGDNGISYPSIIWNGNGFAVVWYGGSLVAESSEIYMALLNKDGIKQGDDIRITYAFNPSYKPRIVWTGVEYGIVWEDLRDKPVGSNQPEIYFVRVSKEGVKIGDDIRITYTDDNSLHPDITWTGSNYGIVWQDYDENGERQIYFIQLNHEGTKKSPVIQITSNTNGEYSVHPSITWSRSDYGISWEQNGSQIFFTKLNKRLRGKIRIKPVSDPAYRSHSPRIYPCKSRYGIFWYQNMNGNTEIFFSRL